MSTFDLDLNIKSEQLDQVSVELSAALQKILAATNNASTKKQDVNLDLSKTFLPFNDAIKFTALTLTGFGKNVVSVSKELTTLKTKLAELSSTASSGKASGQGVLNVNANTKFDTTGLEFSLKGSKEIDLSKIDIDTSKVKVVLTNTDIKLDAQVDGKINVEPVNLRLSGLIQKELAKSLTVGAVSLEKVVNDQVKAALKQTNIDLVAGSIDLSDSVKKLSDDLNLEILNAGADFNLAKAVTDLETKLNSLINQATSSVSEVNVAPVNLKISGLIQGKINDNLTVGDINLGSSFGAGLKKAITEAITVEDITVSLDLQPSIDALVQNLSARISSAADSFNINNVVDELEQSLVKLINDAKPVKSKVKAEEIRKSAVAIPQAIPVKLLVPKAVAVKGIIDPVEPIKVKVQTPEEIKIEADLTADFVEALSKVKIELAANADKLITELDAFDVSATDITDVVEGFLSEVVAKFKSALKISDLSELSSIVKDVQAVSEIDLGTDLKQELTKLSTKLSDQIVASGGSFEISESIQKLNQAINNDVNSIDFDFASAFKSLNLKFQNSVESISFKIEPIELAINALFGKIETALNNVETKSGSSVVSSAINDVKEKELIQRGLFQKVIPAFQQSRDLGEITTGKINGSTKEGKARNALVEQKANAALTILSKVAGDVENLGRTEAEAIANLVGELENVFEDLTPATSEAKKLVSAVSTRVNQLAEKSAVLKNSLASERDAEFTPLSLSENSTAAIRIRRPKESTKITPNEATIEGGAPGQIRAANKQIEKEAKELAFDLRVLQKDISNPKIKTALDNFATTAESTALILGRTVEELAQIDPGFLRNTLQQSLASEGIKFTATQGLGFNKDAVDATQKDEQSGIGGMLNLLATFTTDFVKAQLGGNNPPDTSKFEQAGRDFADQTTKQIEPALVEVVKPEEVKKNEEKAAKKEAERPTPKPEPKEEELKPKAKDKAKAESKLPVETVVSDFQSALKTLKNELTALALVARATGKKKDLDKFETAAANGLASLRPDKTARGVEPSEQRAALDAEIARTALRVSALKKLTTLAPDAVGGRAEVNRVSKNVSDQIKVGDLEEAKRLLNQTKATVKKDAGESGVVDPAILRNFDNLQIQINDAELKQEVAKLTEEIKAGKVDGSADVEFLKQSAEELKSLPASGSFSASQDILLAIKSLETSFKGTQTKDFKEAISIAGTQAKLGEFDNAKATLQNARGLANGELQNNQVSVAELAIDTSDLKSIFDKFLTQVNKLDLAGISDKGISDLKISAAKFVNFPDLALKARNKIDGLQTKLDRNTPKPPDSFRLNFKSAQSELSIGQLEAAKSFLLVAESFAKGREEINEVVSLFSDIRVEEIKGKVKGITDQITELKLGEVNAEGIQKIKSQVNSVGDKDSENKLLLTLKGLLNSLPKEKKVKSEFGELISTLNKEKDLGKPLSAEDLGKITALAITRNQKAAVDLLLAVKETKPVDEFPAQSKLIRGQIRNDNVQEADVEKLKTLAKTRNQAEELLSILKKIENVSIERAFVSFKKEAEALLTSGNKISKFQAARLEESAGQFQGSSKGDAADRLVGQIKDGLDPFKLLAQEIQTSLKNGKVSEPGKLDNLSRLARTDSDADTVKGLRKESKKVQLENEFSAFKDAVQTFKNSNDKSAAAIASVKDGAELFKGTDKEIQANTISQRFQGKPADAFREELRLQELNKTNGKTVDSSKLNQLASTDIEKALVFKLENALDKANFDVVFKEFSQLVKSAINDIKEGVQNPEALNQINESASLFVGTPREIDATSQALSLQAVIDADQNRKFKAAKTSVAQNLPDAGQAVQFIKDLSESSSKLANQAKGFLALKESSALLAGFTEEIIEIQRALKQKGANVPELQAKLGDIGDRFSASEVRSNKAVDSRLFSTGNQLIGLGSGQQAADFTKGTQLVKLGKTEDARRIFEELASDASSIGRQAQIALNKLDEVFTGLTKGEEQLLRELTAKFNSLKATSKNTGDLSALKDLATKSSQQNQTIQGSDRTDLFKDRFNKIAQDVEAAANPKSAAEKEKDRSGKDIGLTDLKSGFDIIRGTLQSTAEGLKALASAASVTSINLAKLDLANKGTVGQTAKDFEFAKSQANATGIGEQATLRDLAAFKLAIPGADQLDSNGGRVTQSVGAKEVEQILKGLQSAGTANQLSGDEQAGASNAVLQILSKGQVQSEELKRQLANFLPGTVSTFAQSQGITTAELEGRLKRGEVGIDSLIGFSELLEKKFGKIAEQDTPTKAVNKLSGNIQEVGIRAAAPGGAAIQTGLGVVNPLLSGVKDSTASLTTAASGIGLVIGAKFAQEAATKIGAAGQLGEVLKKTAGLFVLDPNSSIKEQAFAGKFSALGKVAGLTLGAGILTSVSGALTGAEGLDSLFAKSTKNLQFLLSGIKLPGFGDGKDKDETGAAKDTLLADVFTQIIPAALLLAAAFQALTGAVEKTGARLKTNELKKLPEPVTSKALESRQIKENFKKVDPPAPVSTLPKAATNVEFEKAKNAQPTSKTPDSNFPSEGVLNRDFEKAKNAQLTNKSRESSFPSDGLILRQPSLNSRPENNKQTVKPFTDTTLGSNVRATSNDPNFKGFSGNTISDMSRKNLNGFVGNPLNTAKVEAALEAISRISFETAKNSQPIGNRFQSQFLSDGLLNKDFETAKNAQPNGNRFQSQFLSDGILDKDFERAKNAQPTGNKFQSKFTSDGVVNSQFERAKDAQPVGNRFQSQFLSDVMISEPYSAPKPKSKTAFGSVNGQEISTPKVDRISNGAKALGAGAGALGGAALGLLTNPLTAVIAPLVIALGAYGLSTVKFQSAYAEATNKQVEELKANTAELRKKNGNKDGSFGANQSEDTGAFGINTREQNARDQNVLDQITSGEAKIDLVSNFGLKNERNRAQKAIAEGRDFETGFFGEKTKDNKKTLAAVNEEIAARQAGKAPSERFKAVTDSTGLFTKDLEESAKSLEAFKENLLEASKAVVLSKEDAAKLATDKSSLINQENQIKTLLEAAPSKDADVNKQRALQLVDAKSKAQEARKAILDIEVTPARKKVADAEQRQKDIIARKALLEEQTGKNTEELKNDPLFLKQIEELDEAIKLAGNSVKTAKEELSQIDPAVKLAKAATVKENADILTDRSAQARGLVLTGKDKASIDLRSTEGNDRSQSVRSAKLNTETISSDLQTLEDKLNSAKEFQASVQLAPLADDFDDKIKAANKEVLDLQLETEKKRTEIASSKLSERIAIEAKISEEADRKRLKQERQLNTQEAKGQLSNTVDANFQFNINNSRLSEASAIRQEDVSKKQVKDQEIVVKQTVVGKEAQQDKLDDLKVASLQKSAARQAAVRSRREAEENRLLEVADIANNNRNRKLTNQNSLASRVQQTFSPADQVRSAIQTEKASGRNSDAARIDIEKQILVLSQTRFSREQQSQKLEDLKSSKLQKDTDLYLAQLARVRAEYELLSTVIANTRAAREALSSAKTQTAENINEVKFQNKTGAISNDLAGTDTSARDAKAKTEQLQANRRTQDGLDRVAATGLASDLTTKLRKLGTTVDFGSAAKPALNATPVQLEQKISAVDTSLRQITLKQAKGDQSDVAVNDGGIKFSTNSIEAIQAYKEFLESFRATAAKKEGDNLAIFSSKKAEQKGSIERASNSQRNTEQTQIDTRVAKKTEELNRDGVRSRQKDRVANLQDRSDDSLTTSTRATATALKTEASQKVLSDAVLTTESSKKVRTLTANRDQALAAGQGDEANKLDSEISAEIEKLRTSLTTTNFSTLESGIDNIFAELKKQTTSSERIAELNQEQLNRSRSVFELRKSLGLIEESDKDASSREVGNKIDDSNAAIAKAKKDLNKESTPSKVIDNLKTLDDATKANPVLNSLAREALRVAETLAKSGKLTGSAISDIISSLDSLTISATEKATAIKFAADKIDQANSLERNQAISDVRDSSDALTEKQTTGRFSGIENSSIVNENKRSKIDNSFALRIQAIDNEEFANKDNLTAEQKQVKFGSKREIARNNRDLDLSEIKSDSRKLAGDISELITSNLKFDQFFKDIATDGDIGKAASRIGESLFDGLANYFSQKAQKSLNDVIGSFFENLFDGIFGIVKDKAKESADPAKTAIPELISAVTNPVSSEIKPYPAPSVALAKMAAPNALVGSIPTLEPQVLPLPPLKDIPQVESYPAPSLVVDEESLGKSIAESIPDTQNNLETLTEPYPQPFYDLGANGVGTPVPDAEYVPAPDTGKPFFFPDYLGEKLDTDNNDDYDWRNDLQGKAQPISNASGDWMNQETLNIRESTRNSEALEANTQALLTSESARAEIPSVPSQGGFDIPVPLSESVTEGLTGSNLAEDDAFTNNLPSTIGEISPALNQFKSALESTNDPILSFGATLLNALSGLGGGGGGDLFSSVLGGLGSLFGGGGGGSEVGSAVLGDLGGSFDLPSFADGNIREALNMPRTPGGKDLRERGADSRLAVLNAQEFVLPAGMAQEFLAYKASGGYANSLVNNNNSTSSNTSNNTTNNSYSIQTDSFGRASSAQTIISDPVSATRKRFNTNK